MRYQPRVTEEEMELMARHLGIDRRALLKKYVMATKIGYLLRQRGGMCVFLEREKDGTQALCRIYDHRPAPCRDWTADLSRRECREGLDRLGEAERAEVLRDQS
jgi:Fe-S-cluster containining protein